MTESNRRRLAWTVLALAALVTVAALAALSPGRGSDARVDAKFLASRGISYRLVARDAPRMERIHVVRVDLANPDIELEAVPSDKPADPATAELTPPAKLAAKGCALVFVNANPWVTLDGSTHANWHDNQPVRVMGMVVSGGAVRCPPTRNNCGFYVDRAGRARVGNPDNVGVVDEGIAGFQRLLEGGAALFAPKEGEVVAPRSAVGLDPTGRWLTIVVVDGRQEKFSMGMSYSEMCAFLKSQGCSDAVNLDGGGSSILLVASANGTRRVVNSPSDSTARPIPVGLAVRLKPR